MLTDTKIKQAKVTDKPYKIYDSEGLYIEVAPTGSKRWRWRYRWNGKEKLLSFGIYPEVPLKLARDRRAAAKELLVSGVDPSQARKEEKVESRAAENSFAAMAEEWYSLYSVPWSEHYKGLVRRRIDEYLIPRLGKRSLSEITPIEIMGILTSLEKRGVIETANRVLGICSQIFRRAVATGKAKSDPCRDLRGALAPAPGEAPCRPDHERRCACCDACPRCVSGQLCGVCGGAFHGPDVCAAGRITFCYMG